MSRALTHATVRGVIAHVVERTGVEAAAILSASRKASSVHARRRAMRLLRRLGYSLPQIGGAFGRHHTTVLDATCGGRQRARQVVAS